MSRYKISLSVFLLFTALNTANAQIENEIISFVDSTELFVNNGRRMLLQNLQDNDYHKIIEIYDFLNERTSAINCAAFTYNEDLYIAILTHNWDDFLKRVEFFSEIVRESLCFPIRDQMLGRTLYQKVENNVSQLLENALTWNLTLEDKELLELYFYLIENQRDETYGKQLKNFKKNYPQSRYKDFVNHYMPGPLNTYGMAFSLGATQIFPTGSLSNYFAPSFAGNFSVDFYFNNLLLAAQVNIGSMKFKTPLLSQTTGYDRDFQKNDCLSYIDGGLLGGYTLLRNNRLQLTPFVYLGGTTLGHF